MKYYKIKASFYGVPDKLYRVILVREDQDLLSVSAAILNTLNVTYEHMFIVKDKKNLYVHPSWIDGDLDYLSFVDVSLNSLHLYSNNNFKLIYDTGENWEFDCKIYKNKVELKNDKNPKYYLLEAKGAGIWEDNMETYYEYQIGNITDSDIVEYDEMDDEHIYTYPFNLDLESLSDTDMDLDTDVYNEDLDEMVEEDINYILGD